MAELPLELKKKTPSGGGNWRGKNAQPPELPQPHGQNALLHDGGAGGKIDQ